MSCGEVAQLGERLPCTQEVASSNLVFSTKGKPTAAEREAGGKGSQGDTRPMIATPGTQPDAAGIRRVIGSPRSLTTWRLAHRIAMIRCIAEY